MWKMWKNCHKLATPEIVAFCGKTVVSQQVNAIATVLLQVRYTLLTKKSPGHCLLYEESHHVLFPETAEGYHLPPFLTECDRRSTAGRF